ncbi:bacteriophage holin [Saccharopolyspora hordei]|uniref:Membrane protein implicated in regulation of membrane protease activity n=1 Tax=Saccharopolyspora hordei TaxID=1838 RepID=A0A853AJ95_9PSEU|nr:membrane protein implicated in regulation of membrane protease activity [Saccharopolyspora hordei]
MPYVWSLVLLGAGLVLLVVLLVRLLREVKRFQSVQRQVAHDLADRSGLVKARAAGLGVALAERRRG